MPQAKHNVHVFKVIILTISTSDEIVALQKNILVVYILSSMWLRHTPTLNTCISKGSMFGFAFNYAFSFLQGKYGLIIKVFEFFAKEIETLIVHFWLFLAL